MSFVPDPNVALAVFLEGRSDARCDALFQRALNGEKRRAVFDLAVRRRLSSHDAVCLDRAMRLALPLAPRNKALIAAARAEGVDASLAVA